MSDSDNYDRPETPLAVGKTLKVLNDVLGELESAYSKHSGINSLHEGYAIVQEELDEAWEETKKKRALRDLSALRKEYIQVAAMALRTILDVIDPAIEASHGR